MYIQSFQSLPTPPYIIDACRRNIYTISNVSQPSQSVMGNVGQGGLIDHVKDFI